MPVITVQFAGICTFFLSGYRELHGDCRVVLIDAWRGKDVGGRAIPPHQALMTISGGEAIELHGLRTRLCTTGASAVEIEDSVRTAPTLTTLMRDLQKELAPPSPSAVFDGNAEEAAFYFDFREGALSASRNSHGAFVTTLRVHAQNDIWLESTPFSNKKLPAGLPAIRSLADGDSILISNLDQGKPGPREDFLLHYLTAARVPEDPPLPPLDVFDGVPPDTAIGAGCSNSTYP